MSIHPILALSPKEKQAIALTRERLSNKEISEIMGVKHKTVANYLYRASRKINARGRTEILLILEGKLDTETTIIPSRINAHELLLIKIKKLISQGLNTSQISQRLGISIQAIRCNLIKLGIPRRKYTRRNVLKKNQKNWWSFSYELSSDIGVNAKRKRSDRPSPSRV